MTLLRLWKASWRWGSDGGFSSVRAGSLVLGESVGEAFRSIQTASLAREFAPGLTRVTRKTHIALEIAVDLREVEALRDRQRGAVKLLAADHEHRLGQAHATHR